ncbi:MAG TPA: hypothetical protein VNI01_09450, partial [Elusimicrobiota bacterium]|nr:hypothetical protein [Elusimicrobiota bacterium]
MGAAAWLGWLPAWQAGILLAAAIGPLSGRSPDPGDGQAEALADLLSRRVWPGQRIPRELVDEFARDAGLSEGLAHGLLQELAKKGRVVRLSNGAFLYTDFEVIAHELAPQTSADVLARLSEAWPKLHAGRNPPTALEALERAAQGAAGSSPEALAAVESARDNAALEMARMLLRTRVENERAADSDAGEARARRALEELEALVHEPGAATTALSPQTLELLRRIAKKVQPTKAGDESAGRSIAAFRAYVERLPQGEDRRGRFFELLRAGLRPGDLITAQRYHEAREAVGLDEAGAESILLGLARDGHVVGFTNSAWVYLEGLSVDDSQAATESGRKLRRLARAGMSRLARTTIWDRAAALSFLGAALSHLPPTSPLYQQLRIVEENAVLDVLRQLRERRRGSSFSYVADAELTDPGTAADMALFFSADREHHLEPLRENAADELESAVRAAAKELRGMPDGDPQAAEGLERLALLVNGLRDDSRIAVDDGRLRETVAVLAKEGSPAGAAVDLEIAAMAAEIAGASPKEQGAWARALRARGMLAAKPMEALHGQVTVDLPAPGAADAVPEDELVRGAVVALNGGPRGPWPERLRALAHLDEAVAGYARKASPRSALEARLNQAKILRANASLAILGAAAAELERLILSSPKEGKDEELRKLLFRLQSLHFDSDIVTRGLEPEWPGILEKIESRLMGGGARSASSAAAAAILRSFLEKVDPMQGGPVGPDVPRRQTARLLAGSYPVLSKDTYPSLYKFGRNLSVETAEGKWPPLIGRKDELRQMVKILLRKDKNNPVVVGEKGVGKTHLVAGLARMIAAGEVP